MLRRVSNHLQYEFSDSLARYNNETTYRTLRCVIDEFIPAGATVLDVGCGRGEIMKFLSEKGCKTFGCDYDPICVKISSKFGKTIKSTVTDLRPNTFPEDIDFIVCSHVLEHLENPTKALQKLLIIAKKNIIIAIPNAFSFPQFFRELIRMKTREVNPGHRCIWDRDHFFTLVRNGAKGDVIKWYSDSVFLPLPHKIRRGLLRIRALDFLEGYFMKALFPRFSRSIIAIISANRNGEV